MSRNKHRMLCNGAGGQPGRKHRSNADATRVWNLWTYTPQRNVTLKIGDITDRLARTLPPVVIDLLEISALVYAADQCCRRTPGKRFEYGSKWRRMLEFEVGVRCPDFWNDAGVNQTLNSTLHFLSDDDYKFHFELMKDPPLIQEYIEYGGGIATTDAMDQVMLMSGGVDSLVGAVDQVLHNPRRVAMVSHKPVNHLAQRQRDLVKDIAERAQDAGSHPLHIQVMANKVGELSQDATQRSRSFLYASLGSAVAHLFGLNQLSFYENGIVSVNLPLCGQEVGGRATRTTHPQTLHGFGRIFSLVYGRPFTVKNEYFWLTKQDVMARLRDQEAELARTSVSCIHTREHTKQSPHCGLCSQCVSRRFAALGAGYDQYDPAAGYQADVLAAARPNDEDRILAERFVGQAREVARMTSAEQFHRAYAGELSRVYPYLNMPPKDAAAALFELHRRHAEQVSNTLISQIAKHAHDHWHGRLPGTSVLTYAFRNGTNASSASKQATHREQNTGGLTIDEAALSVSLGSKTIKFRGRSTQPFSLMARITRRVGTRIWFDDLRGPGGVWADRKVEDVTIRGAVSRLKKQLKKGGLSKIAQAISTGTIGNRQFVLLDLDAHQSGEANSN